MFDKTNKKLGNVLASPLGAREHRDLSKVHSCPGCVNKAAAKGAIDVMGGSMRIATRHSESYRAFEVEVTNAWKDAARKFFAANPGVFADGPEDKTYGAELLLCANLLALNALHVQMADIVCAQMSPLDRIGYLSGSSRASQMLTLAGTFDMHVKLNNAPYTDAQAAEAMDDVLEDPIPKQTLIDIAEAWADWAPGKPHPAPSDFIVPDDKDDNPLDSKQGIRDVIDAIKAAAQVNPMTDPTGALTEARKIHELAKRIFPEGSVQRADLDRQFADVERAYAPLVDKTTNTGAVKAKLDAVVGSGDLYGAVSLEFDHKPSIREVAEATFASIKAKHPDAKITVEQLVAALEGKQVPGVTAIRIGG